MAELLIVHKHAFLKKLVHKHIHAGESVHTRQASVSNSIMLRLVTKFNKT